MHIKNKCKYSFYIYSYQDYIKIEPRTPNLTLKHFRELEQTIETLFGKSSIKEKVILLKINQSLNSHIALVRYFKQLKDKYLIIGVYYHFSHSYIVETSNTIKAKVGWELTPYSLESKFHLIYTVFNQS